MAKRAKSSSETLGERLRRAREKAGFSVEDVAKRTKMPSGIVLALEEDRVLAVLSPVYARGFLRLYARLVGLEEQPLLAELVVKPPAPTDTAAPPVAPPPTPIGAPHTAPMAWPWARLSLTREHKRLLIAGGAALLLLGLILTVATRAKSTTTGTSRPSRATSGEFPAISVPASEPLTVQLKAVERTWIRVTADGKVLFQNVLDKGTTERWSANEQLALWLGNAGGVELTLNGRALGTPGRRGEVIRELTITHSGVQRKR